MRSTSRCLDLMAQRIRFVSGIARGFGQAQRLVLQRAGRPRSIPSVDSGLSRSVDESFYRRHAPSVYRYLVARAGPTEAEDLLSETFVGALTSIETYNPSRGTERAWLMGIATNLLKGHSRASARRGALTDRLERVAQLPVDVEVGDRADASALIKRLAPHLLELSETDLDILVLNAWADLEPTEIASALGLRPGTVRSRLHRLRSKLSASLSDQSSQQVGVPKTNLFSR